MRKLVTTFAQRWRNHLSFHKLLHWSGQSLFLPFYHSIRGAKPLPHLQHLYPLRSVRQFEEDLDFFCRYFQPIGLNELLNFVQCGTPLPKKAFFLSFDDGLKEVYTIAAPILQQKGIPATVFINPAFIDNNDLFFRYKAGMLIDHFHKTYPSKAVVEELIFRLQAYGYPDTGLKTALLKINYARRALLDEIAEMLEIDFSQFCRQQQPYLTTAQIQALIDQGITIGGHSVDHPLYKEIPQAEQIRQTSASITSVQDRFDLNYRAFAFPFTDHGVKKSFFEKIEKDRIADITFGCAGLKKQTFPFHFQRIPMEESQASASDLLKGELLYFLLKAPLGKNKIKY